MYQKLYQKVAVNVDLLAYKVLYLNDSANDSKDSRIWSPDEVERQKDVSESRSAPEYYSMKKTANLNSGRVRAGRMIIIQEHGRVFYKRLRSNGNLVIQLFRSEVQNLNVTTTV